MADDYTPTTEEVRNHYAYGCGPEHTWAETREDFDRWLGAHDAEKRAEWEAEQGEVEWEYGTRCPMRECTEPHLLDGNDSPPQAEESLWRRTKARDVPAGEWVPVNENGEHDADSR